MSEGQRVLNEMESANHRATIFRAAVESSYGGIEGLHEVTGRPTLAGYLGQLWQRRHFTWWQSRSRFVTGHDGSRLGQLWLVVRPLLDAVFYWLIFGVLLQFDRGMSNYVAFVIIGVFMFQFTSSAMTSGTRIIASNRSIIRAFQFPRMALPLGELVFDLMQRGIAILVMFAIILSIPPHETPEWSWLLFPVILLLQSILNFGLMLVLARFAVWLPDLEKLMQFVTRLLMYGSGVIFPIARVTENFPVLQTIVEANPIYVILSMYREVLIDGSVPSVAHWITLAAWALILSIMGFFLFWSGEESFGRAQHP